MSRKYRQPGYQDSDRDDNRGGGRSEAPRRENQTAAGHTRERGELYPQICRTRPLQEDCADDLQEMSQRIREREDLEGARHRLDRI